MQFQGWGWFQISEVHNLQLVAEGDSEFGGGDGFFKLNLLWGVFFLIVSPWPKKLSIIMVPLNNGGEPE